jgi:hypothetical protein
MYGVATYRMAAGLGFGFLDWLPKGLLGVALVAWALTLVEMGRFLLGPAVSSVRRRPAS